MSAASGDGGAPAVAGAEGRPARFGARLAAAMASHGPLCVGIDPHPGLLERWGLPDDVTGLRRFALTVAETLTGQVAALKPQSAFFERHGSAGIAVLEEVLAVVRSDGGGTQLILDAKRGDIGSTMDGYADAYLRDGAPLACDALTVSPYLGFGSLAPAVAVAERSGRGLFVLALTSNPEGAAVQHATVEGARLSVAGLVAQEAGRLNVAELEATGLDAPRVAAAGRDAAGLDAAGSSSGDADAAALGSVGLVVGATVGEAVRRLGIDLAAVRGPLLAPGVGAQGAGSAELRAVFGDARSTVLASTSRAVLAAGPDPAALRAAATSAAESAGMALR